MHQWATPGPPLAPPAPVVAPPPDRARVVTPAGPFWPALAVGLLVALLPLVGALVAPGPDRVGHARAVVEDVDGHRATINVVDRPQPSRFVVRWEGGLRQGDIVPVRLVGECGCQPVPATTGAGRTLADLAAPLLVTVLLLGLVLAFVVAEARARQARGRSRAAARAPQAVVPVWARPVWAAPGTRLALDLYGRGGEGRIGRLPLGPVSVEMRPWEPYVLLGGPEGSAALVSEDGARLVLGSGRFDRTPSDGALAPDGAVLDAAMRWGTHGDDPRWAAAFRRARTVASVVAAVVVVEVAAAVALARAGLPPLVALPLVLATAAVAPQLGLPPLVHLVQEHTGAPRRVARRAARVAARRLVTTGA